MVARQRPFVDAASLCHGRRSCTWLMTAQPLRVRLCAMVATDQPFDDRQRWIELRIPKSEGRVVLFTPDGHESRIGGFAPVVFWTDDIDATYAELQANGVETDGPPQKAEWGSSVSFRDPDGTQYLISTL